MEYDGAINRAALVHKRCTGRDGQPRREDPLFNCRRLAVDLDAFEVEIYRVERRIECKVGLKQKLAHLYKKEISPHYYNFNKRKEFATIDLALLQ